VPDLNNTALLTFNGWTLRVRESSSPSPRLLLLIHGLTGDENSMWVFARELPSYYWMIAARAPYPSQMKQGGYTWRLPQFEDMNQVGLDLLRSSAQALIKLVDQYAASVGLDARTFDVMGFSQGAAMSNVLAFLYAERIQKAGILAGFVPAELKQLVAERPLEGKSFFVAHGTKDESVSIDRARESVQILEQAGAQVTYCEDNVGHKVSLTCLRALKGFFAGTRSSPVGKRSSPVDMPSTPRSGNVD
jgi:phospholipase/carboxylesterase